MAVLPDRGPHHPAMAGHLSTIQIVLLYRHDGNNCHCCVKQSKRYFINTSRARLASKRTGKAGMIQ